MDSYSKDALSKQTRGLTSLAFAQVDPGRPSDPPYLHSVYRNNLLDKTGLIVSHLSGKTEQCYGTEHDFHVRPVRNSKARSLSILRYIVPHNFFILTEVVRIPKLSRINSQSKRMAVNVPRYLYALALLSCLFFSRKSQ